MSFSKLNQNYANTGKIDKEEKRRKQTFGDSNILAASEINKQIDAQVVSSIAE
jgi:hypothetical protein